MQVSPELSSDWRKLINPMQRSAFQNLIRSSNGWNDQKPYPLLRKSSSDTFGAVMTTVKDIRC